jgi:hypothetical protein
VELGRFEIERGHLLVRNFYAGLLLTFIDGDFDD